MQQNGTTSERSAQTRRSLKDIRNRPLETHVYGEIENDEVRAEVTSLLKTRPWCRLVIGFARAEFFSNGEKDVLVVRELAGKVRATSYLSHGIAPCQSVLVRQTIRPRKLAGLPWSCGATAIVAPGGVGKTPMLEAFAKAFEAEGRDVLRVRFGEPRGEYESDYSELMVSLALALYNGHDVFIDSFKNPVYDLPGGLSAGGASNALWTTLSDLSSIFDRVGNAFVALINPTTADARVIKNAVESLKSSCCGIITTETGGRWVGFVREIETGERLAIAFHSSASRFEYEGSTSVDAELADSVKTSKPVTARIEVDSVLAGMLTRITR